MSPAMSLVTMESDDETQKKYHKGVKQLLCENKLTKLPKRYVLPAHERPCIRNEEYGAHDNNTLQLPVIDSAELQGPNRAQALKTLSAACENYGFFQLVNHGIPCDVVSGMRDVSRRFFELSYEERSKYMSSDMRAPVRYGTSFNQNKDNVFCWRDFLKLKCEPSSPDLLSHWPSSPVDFRNSAAGYANETRMLFVMLMEAILESLLIGDRDVNDEPVDCEDEIVKELKDGSQLMVLNCYPPCPEPDLTLGMPPHSDYGLLTLLLQDEVKGLQIQHREKWVNVEPIPNSFVVNVGDHLENIFMDYQLCNTFNFSYISSDLVDLDETFNGKNIKRGQIFSNGRYKSVVHRVIVNSGKSRISVASLHSLPFTSTVKPWPRIVDEANPRRYKDTDFATFLEYISSREPKKKNFLESRKLII